MGSFTSYMIGTAVFLSLLWGCYRLFLEKKKQFGFNRAVIMAIYFVSFCGVSLTGFWNEFAYAHSPSLPTSPVLTDITISIESVGVTAGSAPGWAVCLVTIYFSGLLMTLLFSIISLFRMSLIISRGSKVKYTDKIIIVITERPDIAPFSWGRYIVLTEKDYSEGDGLILTHETAHLVGRHWLDLLIAQCVCIFQWFNPAAWVLRKELRMIHEYEADEAVIKSEGTDQKEYQWMLLRRVADPNREQFLTNNLNTSNLKKRILMMKKTDSRLRSRLGALALLPAMAVAGLLIGTDSFAKVRNATSDAELSVPVLLDSQADETLTGEKTRSLSDNSGQISSPSEVTENKTISDDNPEDIFFTPEQLAEFPGGMKALMEWLGNNIRFPEPEVEGRVIVQFTIGKDGKVTDPKVVRSISPEADAEALRVVGLMPRWEPGKNNGKPVATKFTLPISFKMTADAASEKSKSKSTITVRSNDTEVTNAGEKVSGNFDPKSPNAPVIFVDGERFNGDWSTIPSDQVEAITVDKSKPDYPNGRIDITMKKSSK